MFVLFLSVLSYAQNLNVNAGLVIQKTESLYWENGVGVDISTPDILNERLHLTANYVSSRFGTAMKYNALKQDNILVGLDWHFFHKSDFQIKAGVNTGLFVVDYESHLFDDLPSTSVLLQLETGLSYRFKFPVTTSLSVGYNLISGDGISVPGTLFPVFYKLSVFYRFK